MPFKLIGGVAAGKPYNCGASKNAGVRLLPDTVEIVVLADADTVPRSYSQIAEATWRATDDEAGLIYVADTIRCLLPEETEGLHHWRQALDCPGDGGRETDSMSGLLVIRRDKFEEVGGFDPGYSGYGFEDLAFRRECARRWPVHSVRGEAIHFWHRPDPGKDPSSDSFLANEARWIAGAA